MLMNNMFTLYYTSANNQINDNVVRSELKIDDVTFRHLDLICSVLKDILVLNQCYFILNLFH